MENKYQQLYDKVLGDPKFRNQLALSPAEALRSLDIEPTEQVLQALNTVIVDIGRLERIFSGRQDFAP